jgi:hypothetical protein
MSPAVANAIAQLQKQNPQTLMKQGQGRSTTINGIGTVMVANLITQTPEF